MSVLTQEGTGQYELSGWDLSHMLSEPSEEIITARLAELEEGVQTLESRRDDLSAEMDPEILVGFLREYEKLVEDIHQLAGYARLWFAEDTQSDQAITYLNRIQHVVTEASNRLLFFSLWWKGLEEDKASRLLPSEESHSDFRHFLQEMRLSRPYTLDEKSEQIINLKDADGIGALTTIYSMLTTRLEFTLEVDGEEKKLTRGEMSSYFYSPDPEMRAQAYQQLYKVYAEESPVLAQIYANRVRDWYNENVRLRGFSSPIAVRNLANDVPDEAVDALLQVTQENAGVFQRYFALKARWLGLEKLRRYDVYAPLTESDREIDYSVAVDDVLKTFREFDAHFAQQAERVFTDRHIDAEIRKGKRGGAFCSTITPDLTPYVLMNWTNKVRDVATLAHELGHAVHSMLAEHHSVLTQHSSLPLAETASVFAEMVMTDRLLAKEKDPLVRREILATAVDDIYATVLRQAFFVLFEIEAHAAIRENASVQSLNERYMANLKTQFGDSVEIGEEFQYEWVSIPHIYSTPFYCYAYSFGQLLVLSLYRRYQEEGDEFKPGYMKMLAYGGSARPEEILQEAGIDITDPDFWRGGFQVISEMIDELESLSL